MVDSLMEIGVDVNCQKLGGWKETLRILYSPSFPQLSYADSVLSSDYVELAPLRLHALNGCSLVGLSGQPYEIC